MSVKIRPATRPDISLLSSHSFPLAPFQSDSFRARSLICNEVKRENVHGLCSCISISVIKAAGAINLSCWAAVVVRSSSGPAVKNTVQGSNEFSLQNAEETETASSDGQKTEARINWDKNEPPEFLSAVGRFF